MSSTVTPQRQPAGPLECSPGGEGRSGEVGSGPLRRVLHSTHTHALNGGDLRLYPRDPRDRYGDPRDQYTARYEAGYQPGNYGDPEYGRDHDYNAYQQPDYPDRRPRPRQEPSVDIGKFAGGVLAAAVVTALAAWLCAWPVLHLDSRNPYRRSGNHSPGAFQRPLGGYLHRNRASGDRAADPQHGTHGGSQERHLPLRHAVPAYRTVSVRSGPAVMRQVPMRAGSVPER